MIPFRFGWSAYPRKLVGSLGFSVRSMPPTIRLARGGSEKEGSPLRKCSGRKFDPSLEEPPHHQSPGSILFCFYDDVIDETCGAKICGNRNQTFPLDVF